MTEEKETAERVTRRDLVEGRIEKVVTDRTALVEVSHIQGGLRFENAEQIVDAAKVMATAGSMLPPWLQGNIGGCWGIILKSVELQMSPMTLASMTYEVENRGVRQVAYMSNFFRTIIEQRARIKEKRLHARYEGSGDDMVCYVYATFVGDTEPCEWPPREAAADYTLKKLRPGTNERGQVRGSQLWVTKPAQQQFYAMSRDWGRVYCSALLAGMYGAEELDDSAQYQGPLNAKDVTPNLGARLGAVAEDGFAAEQTIAGIDQALEE